MWSKSLSILLILMMLLSGLVLAKNQPSPDLSMHKSEIMENLLETHHVTQSSSEWTRYKVHVSYNQNLLGINNEIRYRFPDWIVRFNSLSQTDFEVQVDLNQISVDETLLRTRQLKLSAKKVAIALSIVGFWTLIAGIVLGIQVSLENPSDEIEEKAHDRKTNAAIMCAGIGLGSTALSIPLHVMQGKLEREISFNAYAYKCTSLSLTIIDLLTGQESHLVRKTNFVDTEPFNDQLSRQVSDMIEDFFLELRSETEAPLITFNQHEKTVRATYLGIPLQLSDDVELSQVRVKSPRFNKSHLLSGYQQKTEYFEVPLSVGENTITITVTDWCGKTASDVIQVYALKDPDNSTYTLGDMIDDDIPIHPDVIIVEESNVDIDIPQTSMGNQDAVALVIGNRDYDHRDVPSVDYAVRDAQTIRKYLIQTLGYPTANIIYLENTTLSHLRTAVSQLSNQVLPDQSDVFVYYSGHGAPSVDTEKGYLLPVDCNPDFVETGGYSLDEFYQVLGDLPARHTYVVIDACFSGISAAGPLLKNASPVYIKVENSALMNGKVTLFTSATGDQISSWYPDKNHSLFTYYFLRALHGDADLNRDKQLTVAEIQDYIDSNVPRMARRLHNREQTPQVITKEKNKTLIRY